MGFAPGLGILQNVGDYPCCGSRRHILEKALFSVNGCSYWVWRRHETFQRSNRCTASKAIAIANCSSAPLAFCPFSTGRSRCTICPYRHILAGWTYRQVYDSSIWLVEATSLHPRLSRLPILHTRPLQQLNLLLLRTLHMHPLRSYISSFIHAPKHPMK